MNEIIKLIKEIGFKETYKDKTIINYQICDATSFIKYDESYSITYDIELSNEELTFNLISTSEKTGEAKLIQLKRVKIEEATSYLSNQFLKEIRKKRLKKLLTT